MGRKAEEGVVHTTDLLEQEGTSTESKSLSCPLCNPGFCGFSCCYCCLFFLGDRFLDLGLGSNQGTICLSFCLAPLSANAFGAAYGARRWHLVATNFRQGMMIHLLFRSRSGAGRCTTECNVMWKQLVLQGT